MDASLLINAISIFVLLMMAAVFSAAETGIVAVSRARIHQQERQGNQGAKIIGFLQKNLGYTLSSLLLGNTVVNIFATSMATGLLIRLFGETGVIYATVLMSSLIIFYAEILPKIIVIHYPEKTMIAVSPFLKIVYVLFNPVTKILNFMARKMLQMVGMDVSATNQDSTIEELRGLIDMQVGPTDEIQDERVMLRGILDLATVDVDEVMTHRKEVTMLDINQGTEKVIQHVLRSPFTRIPLWEHDPDNIVGVLHVKALFKALREKDQDINQINLREILTPPWFIPETTALLDQLKAFRDRREHFACVVDEYGAFIGIVTLEDILEEIVGEIADEHDIEIPGVRMAQDGSIVIVGTVTIRDLNRQFNWELSDEEAVTIAGLLIHEAQRIPEVGQTYQIGELTMKVLRRQRNQITLLRIYVNDQKEKKHA